MQLQLIGDRELVEMYTTGNEQALAELIFRYKNKIYTSILIIVKNELLAEDLFQDTFIKVIENLRKGKYNEEGKFLPWVLRISHNLCIDYFRRIKRAPNIINNEGKDIFKVIKFEDNNIDERLISNNTTLKIKELIEQLPPEQREVVVLRHYADLSFKEIAEITNVSVNTALGRMRYALIHMRKAIIENQIMI